MLIFAVMSLKASARSCISSPDLQVDLVVERAARHVANPTLEEPERRKNPAWNNNMRPHSIPSTIIAEIQTMIRLVWYCRLRHLQDRPEILVESLGELHHGVVQPLDPRLAVRWPA